MRVIRPGRADSKDGMQIYLSNFTLPEFSPQPVTIQVFSLCVIQSQQLITNKGDNTGDKYAYFANKVISFSIADKREVIPHSAQRAAEVEPEYH